MFRNSITSTTKLRLTLGVFLFVFISASLFAQEFTATVNRNRVAMGEQFELTFILNGAGSGKNFRPPAFNDFLTLSGPNQSTNWQFINGQQSVSISYGYVLQPRAEGKFTIPSATIEASGKTLQTKPITIVVTKGAQQQQRQSNRGGQQQNDADVSQQIGDNLFLRVSVDKSKCYQGEQITATYKIYTRVNIANYQLNKVPALTGFWSEDLEVPKQIQLTNETVNGKQYRVGVLKKVALFAQRSGTLTLDPMEVECVVQVQSRRRSNDIFDQFFNDPFFGNVRNVNYKVVSDPVKITVQELPQENLPIGFPGAVGKFSMEAWLDKKQTKTNEAVTLKIKISGRGNIKLLDEPAIVIPPDLEKYDPKISDNITKQGNLISGSRTFEYLLIPRHAGEQKIASFLFSYFDVDKKTYVTINSPEFVLSVGKGTELASAPVSGISKEDVKLLGEDIRFIKSGGVNLQRRGERLFGSPLFYALSFSPIILFVGFVMFMRKRDKMLGDVLAVRNRKARKMAQQRLSVAKKHLSAQKREEFYNEVARALWGYVSDKLGIPPSDLTIDTVRSSLEQRGVPVESISKLASTFEQCEYARFAPSSDSSQMDSMYNEAVSLISTIEDHVR
ncbi:MAG: protein BatD [Ignavibacteriae bacterium]|nr:protein BatD [Ignavibacteriota bacterium]